MYHFGFCFGCYSDVVILGFVDTCFRIFTTKNSLYFIDKSHIKKNIYSFSDFTELSCPVLFTLINDIVDDIVFLDDFSIVGNPQNISINGSTLTNLYPFEQHNIENTFDKGFSYKIEAYNETIDKYKYKKSYHACLLKNDNCLEFRDNYLNEEKDFIDLIVNYTVSVMMCFITYRKSQYISSDNKFDDSYKSIISKYKKYIDSINLPSLLSSLYVKVWDTHISKVGGDDRYYVYRYAELKDGTIIDDEYLVDLIGLGKVCILEDWGYTSHFERPDIPFGEYSGEVLKEEKRKIISKYSKEEHMGWLFSHQLFKQKEYAEDNNIWEELRTRYTDALNEKIRACGFEKLSNSNAFNFSAKILSLNKYIERKQKNYPDLKVVFAGEVLYKDERIYTSRISTIIEGLSQKYNVIIVSDYDCNAQRLSELYARDHCLEIKSGYIELDEDCQKKFINFKKLRPMERERKMTEIADVIYLTGDTKHCLYKNFLSVATELSKKVIYM